jgi:prophage regulatory protein
MPHERILRLPEVKDRTALSRSSIYKFITEATFPRPVQLGPRAVGWLESEIDGWIADRVASTRHRRSLPPLSALAQNGASMRGAGTRNRMGP